MSDELVQIATGRIARNGRRNSSGLDFADWVATALGRAFERNATVLICNCHACGAWTEGAAGLLGLYGGECCLLAKLLPVFVVDTDEKELTTIEK